MSGTLPREICNPDISMPLFLLGHIVNSLGCQFVPFLMMLLTVHPPSLQIPEGRIVALNYFSALITTTCSGNTLFGTELSCE